MAIKIFAGKEKIAIRNLSIFEATEGGFQVAKSADNHECGTIYFVPKAYERDYAEGEKVILRAKAVSEQLVVEGTEYSFIQPLDILCKYI